MPVRMPVRGGRRTTALIRRSPMTDPRRLDDHPHSALGPQAAASAYRVLGELLAAEQLASQTVDDLAARFRESPADGPAPMAWLASATVEAALDDEPTADGTDGPRRAALRLALRG